MAGGQLLPREIVQQLGNVRPALSAASAGSPVKTAPSVDTRESRAPLTLVGMMCLAVRIYCLLDPEAPVVWGTLWGDTPAQSSLRWTVAESWGLRSEG